MCTENASGWTLRYINSMQGLRGERIHLEYAYWTNFIISMEKTIATLEEGRAAKVQVRELKYTNIDDYLRECQQLNLKIGRVDDN